MNTTILLAREKNVDSKLLGELNGDLGFKYKKERQEERTMRMMGRVSSSYVAIACMTIMCKGAIALTPFLRIAPI